MHMSIAKRARAKARATTRPSSSTCRCSSGCFLLFLRPEAVVVGVGGVGPTGGAGPLPVSVDASDGPVGEGFESVPAAGEAGEVVADGESAVVAGGAVVDVGVVGVGGSGGGVDRVSVADGDELRQWGFRGLGVRVVIEVVAGDRVAEQHVQDVGEGRVAFGEVA